MYIKMTYKNNINLQADENINKELDGNFHSDFSF